MREQRKKGEEEEGRIGKKMVSYLNPCHREHRSDRGAGTAPAGYCSVISVGSLCPVQFNQVNNNEHNAYK